MLSFMKTKSIVTPEIGKVYKMRHERFGKATVKILRQYAEWFDIEIVSGVLHGATGDWGPGFQKTVRRIHCSFSK